MRTNTTNFSAYTAAQAMKNAVTSHGWIVGSFDEAGNVSFSNIPAVHTTEVSARMEATRLAKLNSTKTYIWVQLRGGVKTTDVQYF